MKIEKHYYYDINELRTLAVRYIFLSLGDGCTNAQMAFYRMSYGRQRRVKTSHAVPAELHLNQRDILYWN